MDLSQTLRPRITRARHLRRNRAPLSVGWPVRRPDRGPGIAGRCGDCRARASRCTRCVPISSVAATTPSRFASKSTAFATGAASPPAAWSPARPSVRSSTSKHRSTRRGRVRRADRAHGAGPYRRPTRWSATRGATRSTGVRCRQIGCVDLAAAPVPGAARVDAGRSPDLGDPRPTTNCCTAAGWRTCATTCRPTPCVRAHPLFRDRTTEGITYTASLDHTIWFHRPFRADEWHLYDFSCHGFTGARGLASATCSPPTARTSPRSPRKC